MVEKHWRIVADLDGRILIDKSATGTVWEELGTARSGYWVDIAIAPTGRLYGLDEDRVLHEIDVETGATRRIGDPGLPTVNGFDIDALGRAYVSQSGGGVYRLDLATGASELIADTVGSAGDLRVVDGVLWMSTKENRLVKVDPETGETSSGFFHGIWNVTGLEESDDGGFLAYAQDKVYRVDLVRGELVEIETIDDVRYILGATALPTKLVMTAAESEVSLFGGYDVDVFGNRLENTVIGNAGANEIHGAGGADQLRGAGGADRLFGDRGADMLDGGNAGDVLDGGASADKILGGKGADKLVGGGGADKLYGGAGADTLSGGSGADVLFGGAGADVFRFDTTRESRPGVGVDRIADFQRGIDTLSLTSIDARQGTDADDAFTFVGAAAFSGQEGELRYAGGRLSGDVDGDGAADFVVNILGAPRLTSGDFDL